MAKTSLRRGTQDEGNTDYFTGCPIGGGFLWYGLPTKIPSNCMICDNSTLAISSYAKLNENLGGAWGMSGGSLNIPDLRGRFPRGVDGGIGNDPDRAGRTGPNTGQNTGDAVGSVQDDAMQGHAHISGVHTLDSRFDVWGRSTVPAGSSFGSTNGSTVSAQTSYPINASGSGGVGGDPRTANESRPKNANVYFVIRVS